MDEFRSKNRKPLFHAKNQAVRLRERRSGSKKRGDFSQNLLLVKCSNYSVVRRIVRAESDRSSINTILIADVRELLGLREALQHLQTRHVCRQMSQPELEAALVVVTAHECAIQKLHISSIVHVLIRELLGLEESLGCFVSRRLQVRQTQSPEQKSISIPL